MLKTINYIELIKKLNSGGTATVYLGIDLNMGKPVAVKELHSAFFSDVKFRKKFQEEANRYLELEHPNIVKLEDFILKPESGYLVLEYIEGKNLREYLKQVTGPIPIENVALFMKEVLDALQYAHDMDMVHLDIKPSNIMLSDDNQIRLIDFGISIDGNKNSHESTMGTVSYMSPEQIENKDIDHRTDIFSLGVTMYELITGNLPFKGDSHKEIWTQIKNKEIPDIKAYYPGDSIFIEDVNRIIKRATAKDPDDRFYTCEEFKEELNQII